MSKRNKLFWDAVTKNNASYFMYVERLTNIALSIFKWNNLPDTVDERYLEMQLLMNGYILYFDEPDIGNVVMKGTIGGEFNNYDIPEFREAIGVNGFIRELSNKDSVIIYNDLLHENTMHGIVYYSQRLWDIDRTIDVNVAQQKTPKIIACPENQKLSIINALAQKENNEQRILGYKGLDLNAVSVFDTVAPFTADKCYDVRDRIFNDAMSYLGIPNTPVTKRERTNTAENVMGSGGTVASKYSRLKARQQACKEINDMFGTNISVEYESFLPDIVQMEIDQNNDIRGTARGGSLMSSDNGIKKEVT